MNHVLVTGGAGFIGSHLVERLLDDGLSVVVLDDFSTGKMENLPIHHPALEIVRGDIAKPELIDGILNQHRFDYIVHLAAIASVHQSVNDTFRTHTVNTEASIYLLEAARKMGGLKRFVFASSAAVYGEDISLPKREDSPTRPISPYGIDKFCAEQYMLTYHQLFDVPTVALRYFNVYGPRQNDQAQDAGVISIFMRLFSQPTPRVKIYGDGHQTRDFIYIRDVVEATRFVMKHDAANGNVYNVATGRETSILNIVQALEQISGKQAMINLQPHRKGDIERSCADISRIRALGYTPKYNLEDSLRECFSGGFELINAQAR